MGSPWTAKMSFQLRLYAAVEALVCSTPLSALASSTDGRKSLLGLSWAFAFVDDAGAAGPVPRLVRGALEAEGARRDARRRSGAAAHVAPLAQAPSEAGVACGPWLAADFGDAYVLAKPAGWEVDVAEEAVPGRAERAGTCPAWQR
ncbi:unnamed protein product, partial [Prorocentrum cordatum]